MKGKFILLVVMISCSMAMADQTLICMINYPFQLWNQASTKIHVSLFKPDFTPAKSVNLLVDGKKVGITDDNGVCIFDFAPGEKLHILTAKFKQNEILYKVKKTFQCNVRIADYHVDRLYLYTDRAIYNPGQIILIRCIAWVFKGEYTAVEGAKIKIMLQDGKGHIYSGGYIHTDEYGVGAFKIELPPNIDEGRYDLVVKYKNAKESVPIKIERFVAPVIDIQHNLPRYLTQKQEKLPLEIKLSFFAGGVIRKSQLKLSVSNFGREVFNYEPKEQKPGLYRFTLDKKQLDKIRHYLSHDMKFQVSLIATDEYGRSDTITREITYSHRPYKATLESNKSRYRVGENVKITAKVRELDNRPAAALPLLLKVGAYSWRKNTDEKGMAVFSFVMGENTLTAQLQTPSVSGVLTSIYLPLDKISKKVVTTKVSAKFQAQVSVSFDSDYVPVEKVVHVDLTDISGTIVTATTLPLFLETGIWQAKGVVNSPTWGSMLLNIYCCAAQKKHGKLSPENVGVIAEGQKVTFQPKQKLAISFPGLKLRVKPGEKIQPIIEVQGPDDEYCLGVSMVDEAVLSLGDPMEKKPVDHFYTNELKSMTTTGSAALTWPVLDRNWGREVDDLAYQTWGWKEPGAMVGSKKQEKMAPVDIEMVFVINTSIFMSGVVSEVKNKIPSIVHTIKDLSSDAKIKIGLVSYNSDNIKIIKLSENLGNLQNLHIKNGDASVDGALANAVDEIKWTSEKKTLKLIYLISDIHMKNWKWPEKQKRSKKETYHTVCSRAVKKNIIIHTILCYKSGEKTWQEIALLGKGKYAQIPIGADYQANETDYQLRSLNQQLRNTFFGNKKSAGDLVGRFQNDSDILEKLSPKDLPETLRKLPANKRRKELEQRLAKREQIKYQIQDLERKRRWKLKRGDNGFDTFVLNTVKQAAHNLQNK